MNIPTTSSTIRNETSGAELPLLQTTKDRNGLNSITWILGAANRIIWADMWHARRSAKRKTLAAKRAISQQRKSLASYPHTEILIILVLFSPSFYQSCVAYVQEWRALASSTDYHHPCVLDAVVSVAVIVAWRVRARDFQPKKLKHGVLDDDFW